MGISNHSATCVIINTYTNKKIDKLYTLRDYRSVDDTKIKSFNETIYWSKIDELGDANIQTEIFHDSIKKCLNELCPMLEIKSKYPPVQWMTGEIKNMMKERKSAYKLWRSKRKEWRHVIW